jgi:hypothetical protein
VFLVGWSAQPDATGFGGDSSQSVKTKLINLISAVRTLMRSISPAPTFPVIL